VALLAQADAAGKVLTERRGEVAQVDAELGPLRDDLHRARDEAAMLATRRAALVEEVRLIEARRDAVLSEAEIAVEPVSRAPQPSPVPENGAAAPATDLIPRAQE